MYFLESIVSSRLMLEMYLSHCDTECASWGRKERYPVLCYSHSLNYPVLSLSFLICVSSPPYPLLQTFFHKVYKPISIPFYPLFTFYVPFLVLSKLLASTEFKSYLPPVTVFLWSLFYSYHPHWSHFL